jgi:hypothetical protein
MTTGPHVGLDFAMVVSDPPESYGDDNWQEQDRTRQEYNFR